MGAIIENTALHWLEEILLPIAISAAGLPPEMEIENFILNASDEPNITIGIEDYINDLLIIGASVIANQLANNQRAKRILQCIRTLIVQDAIELINARELAFDTNLEGIDNSEFELRYRRAEEKWEHWKSTDHKILIETEHFIRKCGEDLF